MPATIAVFLTDSKGNPIASGGGGGDASAANQATEIGHLAAIRAGTPTALGQATAAASSPVVLASNQTAIPVNIQIAGTAVAGGAGVPAATVQRVVEARGATAAVTSLGFASLAAAQTLVAAAATRTGLVVQNDTDKALKIRAGATGLSSSSDWSFTIPPAAGGIGARWECPAAFAALAFQVISIDAAVATVGTVKITTVGQ